jgi:pyruvate kinase
MNRKPDPSAFDPRQTAARLTGDLISVREKIVTLAEARMQAWRVGLANAALLEDAANLAHYLALRSLDLRNNQPALSSLGLSSLGRSESRVLPAIDAVLATLAHISGESASAYPDPAILLNGHETLERRKTELFGGDPDGPSTRIMVSLPTEAAADPQLVQQLIANGADCARINCAHDGPDVWLAMIGMCGAQQTNSATTCGSPWTLADPSSGSRPSARRRSSAFTAATVLRSRLHSAKAATSTRRRCRRRSCSTILHQ